MEFKIKEGKDHKKAVADAVARMTAAMKKEGILNTYRDKTEFVPKAIRRKRKAIFNARQQRKYDKRAR